MKKLLKKSATGRTRSRTANTTTANETTTGGCNITFLTILVSIILLGLEQFVAFLFNTPSQAYRYLNVATNYNVLKTTPAVVVPQLQVDPLFQKEHDQIDALSADERCQAFGWKSLGPTQKKPRRLFLGSMVADEGMDMLHMHATEVYDVYHVIALVESNSTFANTPRSMNFGPGSENEALLTQAKLFGNKTQILLDYWLHDRPDLVEMNREVEQRSKITEMWKQAGMTIHDIGIVSDLDEVVSRDFLRALQVCDVPQFRLPASPDDDRPSCQAPKLSLYTIQFDGSPYCIKQKVWYHPDVISGQCIDGIGDPSERVVPLRQHQRRYGDRVLDYGMYDYKRYPPHILQHGMFPLFTAQDIRAVSGAEGGLTNYKQTPGDGITSVYGVAYHLHNWFSPNLQVLRNKYRTYGHADRNAHWGPLASKNEDADIMVRCALDLGNNRTYFGYHYFYDGKGNRNHSSYDPQQIADRQEEIRKFVDSLGGPRPIYFANGTYTKERHALLVKMVQEDEAMNGPSIFPNTCKNLPLHRCNHTSSPPSPSSQK